MSGARTVGDVGEVALVERILGGLGEEAGRQEPGEAGLRLGPGDDAAILSGGDGADWVVTTDCQHEDVHFRRDWIDPATLGRRLLAVNASDIAAMGGRPAWAVVALALPTTTPLALVDGLVEGLGAGGSEFGCRVVGGDVARVPGGLGLCLTALGRLSGEPLLRGGARAGDGCWITGHPGRAGAGRRLLEAGRRPGDQPPSSPSAAADEGQGTDPGRDRAPHVRACLDAFLRPRPPLALGPRLAATGLATAAIDVSDGVALDAGRVCRASGVGLLLDADGLGDDPVLRRLVAAAPGDGPEGPGGLEDVDPVDLVLQGGEDYELLCAVAPADEQGFAALADECGVEVRRVGRFTGSEDGLRLRRRGRVETLEPAGWDHFAVGQAGR